MKPNQTVAHHAGTITNASVNGLIISEEFAESIGVNVEEGDIEFAGIVTLTVGVGNDSVVHKFVLVKKFVYAVCWKVIFRCRWILFWVMVS